MDFRASLLTFELAAATTAILLVLGVPTAWWLARSRHPLRALVLAVTTLPLVLPPTVIGYYLLVLFAPASPLGKAFVAVTGTTLPFTFAGLVVASVVVNLPFALRPMVAGFSVVEERHLEAAIGLGESRAGAFFRVALPLSSRAVLSGAVLVFAHTIGEFGVVLMVGGNLDGRTRTLSLALYDALQAFDFEKAGTTSAVLLGVSFAIVVVLQLLERRRSH